MKGMAKGFHMKNSLRSIFKKRLINLNVSAAKVSGSIIEKANIPQSMASEFRSQLRSYRYLNEYHK